MVKSPDTERNSEEFFTSEAELRRRASEGRPAATTRATGVLPRLSPLDCYYLYNPDGYYRTE